jgi:hypothetical protein
MYGWLSITQSLRDRDKTSRDRGVREIENLEIKVPTLSFYILQAPEVLWNKIMQSFLKLSWTLQLCQVKYLISK